MNFINRKMKEIDFNKAFQRTKGFQLFENHFH